MNFTLRQLLYFQAVAEQRNFGRAAQVCNVSQPALSVQIKALEEAMGGSLLERQARDILLTPLGRDVLERDGREDPLRCRVDLQERVRPHLQHDGHAALGPVVLVREEALKRKRETTSVRRHTG